MSACSKYIFSDDPNDVCENAEEATELVAICDECSFRQVYYASDEATTDEIMTFLMNMQIQHYKEKHPERIPFGVGGKMEC